MIELLPLHWSTPRVTGEAVMDCPGAELDAHPLLVSPNLAVSVVVCSGRCRHQSDEERAEVPHLIFPYRGIYLLHVGRDQSVADANHVNFINGNEPYRVSHPVPGGDTCLSVRVEPETLLELSPDVYLRVPGRAALNRSQLPVDAQTQMLAALLRHRLVHGLYDQLEAESVTMTLIGRALGERALGVFGHNTRRRNVAEQAKIIIASDLGRRWSLSQVAGQIGISPVYLTQVFQQEEGVPLYRYHLYLRLCRALDLLDGHPNVGDVAGDLGFSSPSHFSAAFKQAYRRTPSQFRRDARH
jgi:AraC family transcriptional regulator